MAQNTTFQKRSQDQAFMKSVIPVAAVTNTRLAYKITGMSGRNLAADVCGDNDLIAGFPAQKSTAAQAGAVAEAVRLDRRGTFEAIAQGTIHVNNPLTAGTAGALRVAVVTTDLFQYAAETEALDGEVVQVRDL
jgi:hypothetical protein